ncbi:MAG: GntR family transcriptional regulator [Asticcacaulis sp.]
MSTVQTLSEQIYTRVRDRIISGKLPTDKAIGQDALASELGVSKIPLREAFARLEQDGLLLYMTNRGFFVRPLSSEGFEEVYALRLKIEPEAVALASTLATDKDRHIALLHLNLLNKAYVPGRPVNGQLNRNFHMALVQPIRRPMTIQIIERLNIASERYVTGHLQPVECGGRAHDEHTALYDLWAAGKDDEVAALMHQHINATLQDMRRQLHAHKAEAMA